MKVHVPLEHVGYWRLRKTQPHMLASGATSSADGMLQPVERGHDLPYIMSAQIHESEAAVLVTDFT